MDNNTLTSLAGIRVGHSTHIDRLTGCTVVLFDKPYPVAYKSYGGGAGMFNTDMLRNGMSFYRRHGLFVAGGSLTGLMSASKIMQRMIDDGIGFRESKMINPSISGAVVYDLGISIGQYDPEFGTEAYNNASSSVVKSGNVGAGTGTAVGKFQRVVMGTKNGGMKSGVGSAKVALGNGVIVTAMSVVNALGNVMNPDGTILAGNRDENKRFKTFEDTTNFVTHSNMNTTVTIVGINVDLGTRENYERVAHTATHGQVRAISPVHTSIDGDTVFVFSTEEKKTILNGMGQYFETPGWPLFSVDVIGNAAATATQQSIYDACRSAESIHYDDGYQGTIPSVNDLPT